MLNIQIQKVYSYLYDIVKQVLRGERVSVDEFNVLGSRKSGKTIAYVLFFGILLHLPVRIGLLCFRSSKENIREFFQDVCEIFDSFGIPYKTNTQKLTIYWGHNTIRFIGLNSLSKHAAKRSGMSHIGGVKYIFKFFEERYEFDAKDYQALQEATRGMDPSIQMVTINICNPWVKTHYYIAYCARYQQWNLNQLRETGSQIGIYTEIDPETKIKITKLFHYTNWRAIRDVLSTSEINEIRNTWNIDRNRAMVTDYGMPGYEFGAIYTHLMHKIGKPLYQKEPQFFIAGMDYGWSRRSDVGGKTACYFGTANTDCGVDIYSEYVHDNSKSPKGTNMVMEEIVDFYVNSMKDYCARTGIIESEQYRYHPPMLKVRVDNMAVGVIALLNNVSKRKGYHHWLQFIKCRKYAIQDRIELTLNLMDGHWLRIAPECKNLISEFETSFYEETETQKRAKVNDHSINAFEYAIEPAMYKLARELGLNKLASKYLEKVKLW